MNRLGVDFGGVITDRMNNEADTSFFNDNFLQTPAIPGAFEVLGRLSANEAYQGGIWIVSKCSPRMQKRTRQWMAHQGFHWKTGVAEYQVRFTEERKGKLPIAKELGLTHFVDDRLENLGYLVGSVANLYLMNPSADEVKGHEWAMPHVTVTENWPHLEELLTQQASPEA